MLFYPFIPSIFLFSSPSFCVLRCALLTGKNTHTHQQLENANVDKCQNQLNGVEWIIVYLHIVLCSRTQSVYICIHLNFIHMYKIFKVKFWPNFLNKNKIKIAHITHESKKSVNVPMIWRLGCTLFLPLLGVLTQSEFLPISFYIAYKFSIYFNNFIIFVYVTVYVCVCVYLLCFFLIFDKFQLEIEFLSKGLHFVLWNPMLSVCVHTCAEWVYGR